MQTKKSTAIEVFCHEHGKDTMLTWDRVDVRALGTGKAGKAVQHLLKGGGGIVRLQIDVTAGKVGEIVLECCGFADKVVKTLPKWMQGLQIKQTVGRLNYPATYLVRLPLASLSATGLGLRAKPSRKAARSKSI